MPSPFGTGFVQALTQGAQKQIDQKHDEEEALKKEKRDMYWGIAYDTTGKYSDAQKQAAQQELGKLLGPTAKKGLAKFGDIFGKLSKAQGQPGQDPSQSAPQQQPAQGGPQSQLPTPKTPTPGAQPAQVAGASAAQPGQQVPSPQGAQLPTPKTAMPTPQAQPSGSGLPPIQTSADISAAQDVQSRQAETRKLAAQGQEDEYYEKQARKLLGADASPRDIAEYVGSQGKKLPPVAVAKMTPVRLSMKDGETIQAMRSPDGKYYDLRNNLLDGDAIKEEAGKPSSGLPRFDGQDVTLESAKSQAKSGTKFSGIDGSDIDLDAVPDGMVLQPISMNGKVLFMPVTPGQITKTANNEVYATDKYHVKDIATGGAGATPIGQARVPTVRETSPEGIGGTKSVATPVTGPQGGQSAPPVAPTRPAAPPPQSPPSGQADGAPASSPASPKAQSALPTPKSPAPQAQPGADAGDPILPGISTAQFRQAAAQAAPVAAAVTEIFGDPRQPDLHPLQSYAKLADNPKSQERIGKAIQLTLNGFGDGIKDAAIGVGAGPIHISAGGWGTWLDNKLKGPQAAAGSQAKTLRDVIGQMTPEEKDAYDSTMATMSTMAGLRSISRQSAAMGSLALIERELPKIGLNATTSRQFYDQLQRTAGAISTFANTPGLFPRVQSNGQVVRTGFTPEMQKRITELTSEMEKKKGPNKLPTPPKAGDVRKGYRFKGGDPADKNNWIKAA